VPHVEKSRVLPLPYERVWQAVANVEAFSSFMKSVDSITVLEKRQNYSREKWVARLRGAPFRWEEEDFHYPEEGRIAYRQTQGDLKQFEGEWRLERTAEGTRVTFTCDFDFGIPMISTLLNPVASLLIGENIDAMLDGIAVASQG
jgi:ribosome-associated toxin RatA of RatAB toxin-antitoxin module